MKKDSKQICKKIISITTSAVLIVAVCFCLFVVVQVLGKGYVTLGGYSFFRVVTPSMEPSLSVGEIIITDAVPIEEVQVDDIISFRSTSADMYGNIITHRVVDVERDESGQIRFVTKGDANLSVDGKYVIESNYVGKVVWSSGDSVIHAVVSFVSGRYGFLVCIVFPSVLILAFMLGSGVKTIKRNMQTLVATVEENQPDKVKVNNKEIDQQSYDEMCKRIRNQLMEELKNREDTQENKNE